MLAVRWTKDAFGGFSWKMLLGHVSVFSPLIAEMVLGALCLLGTPNEARLWTLHFQAFGGVLITKYFTKTLETHSQSQAKSQIWKHLKISLQQPVLLYTHLFLEPQCLFCWKKKLKHVKYAMSKSAVISSTYMLWRKTFTMKQST